MTSLLWRALIPSWRFFDTVGMELRLEVQNGVLEDWKDPLAPLGGSSFSLFLNHRQNARLACHSILERFLEEAQLLDSRDAIAALTTYQLILNIALSEIPDGQARFRVLGSENGEWRELFVSDLIERP